MFKNSFTSKLRSRTGSFLLASSVAVASVAVAGLTESPASAAPVSYGNVTASRSVASDGAVNAYVGEELIMTANVNISFSQNPTCHGEELQSGDVVTMTEANYGFVGPFYFDSSGGVTQGSSYTLPNPLPTYLNINTPQIRVSLLDSRTVTFLPKLKITRDGNLLVETTNCVSPNVSANINSGQQYDLSSYVARAGDQVVGFYGQACVDMALVAPGDVLTYSYTMTADGQNVNPVQGYDPGIYWNQPMDGTSPGDTIKDPEPTSLQLSISNAAVPNPTVGTTYSFSMDIKKGNDSVAISCPPSNPGGGGGGGGGGMPPPPPACTQGAASSNASGVTLDSNFGTAGVWTPTESGKNIMIHESIIGNDGKGYVLATVETPMSMGTLVSRLYRLNTDGSIDSTWGTSGYVEVSGGFSFMIQGSNGSFILGGSTFVSMSSVSVLVRLTSAGALDPSWGSGGSVSFPAPPSGSFQNFADIAAGPSGSVYANVEVGGCGQGPCVYTYSVFKVTSTGAVDTNFGTNGKLTVQGRDLRSDSTGAIYVWDTDFMASTATIKKFDANGSTVASFGSNGVLALSARINDATIVGAHMYFVLAERLSGGGTGGGMVGPPPSKTTVARYDKTTGVLDATFATAGSSTVFASGSNDVMRLVPLPDGSFGLIGFSFSMSGPSAFFLLMDSAGTISANLPSTGATFSSGTCAADNLFGGLFTMGGSFFVFGGKYEMNGNVPLGFKFTISGTTTAPSTTAPSTTAPSTNAPSTTAPSTNAPSTNAPSTNAPSTTAPSTTVPSTTAPVATPTLVNSSNQSTLTQQPGSATALVNGQPVTPEVETPANLPAAQVDPEDRSPAEVQSLQAAADDLVSQLNQSAGGSSGLAVVDTPTGANLTGLLTVPVPIENTVLVEAGNKSTLFAALNQDGSVTDVLPGAVIEVLGNGQIGVLASGLTPGETVEFVVMSTPTLLGSYTVAANGTIKGQASLPTNIGLGNHTLVVASPTVQASLGLKVSVGTLPATGSDVSKPLVVALWLLVGGAFVAVIRRRSLIIVR